MKSLTKIVALILLAIQMGVFEYTLFLLLGLQGAVIASAGGTFAWLFIMGFVGNSW